MSEVRGYRGRTAEAQELLGRFDAQFPDIVDPQIRLTVLNVRIHLAFARGDLDDALRLNREADRLVLELGVGQEHLVAGAIAIERRDVGALAEIVRVVEISAQRGRLSQSEAGVLKGALQVLGGDLDGLSRMDAATQVFRGEGLRFWVAVSMRARAMLAPDADGAAAAADEARRILTDLGAVTLLRGLPGGPGPSVTATDQHRNAGQGLTTAESSPGA